MSALLSLPMPALAALRRALAPAAVALTLVLPLARPASAQGALTPTWVTPCASGPCAVNFAVTPPVGGLTLATLVITLDAAGPYTFAADPGGTRAYSFQDDIGPDVSTASITGAGRTAFLDFSAYPVLSFSDGSGYFQLELAAYGTAPILGSFVGYDEAGARRFSGAFGTAVVPEPATVVLLGGGLLALGGVAWRRRRNDA